MILIGIPTYNGGGGRLDAQLANIRQRTPDSVPHRVVVCDDSGRLEHSSQVRDVCARYGVDVVVHATNRGVPTAWNTLVRSDPECDAVVLLNDDILVAPDWLAPVDYAVRSNPGVASFGLNCYFIDQSDVPAILASRTARVAPLNVHYRGGVLIRDERFPAPPDPPDHPPGRVMCPTGCAFAFRRVVWELVGGFDERYFAFYEETDFGVACATHGLPSFVLPHPADNYHLWSATFASAPEIDAGRVMRESRAAFVAKWRTATGLKFDDAPELHLPLMGRIPPVRVRWLGVDGTPREAVL